MNPANNPHDNSANLDALTRVTDPNTGQTVADELAEALQNPAVARQLRAGVSALRNGEGVSIDPDELNI